jgi:hypothetical protein
VPGSNTELSKRFRTSFVEFKRSVIHAHLLARLAGYSLTDFPRKLQEPLREDVRRVFDVVTKAFSILNDARRISKKHESELLANLREHNEELQGQRRESPDAKPGDTGIGSLALQLLGTGILNPTPEFLNSLYDFERVNRYQAVVTTFSYFDAFLSDTVYLRLLSDPRTLRRSKKTLTWAAAMEFDTVDELREHLCQQFVYEFGWGSLKQKLETLSKDLALVLQVTPKQLDFLHVWEQRRHLIVHNGGKVTPRYIGESGDESRAVGARIDVTAEDLELLLATIGELADEVYREMSAKLPSLKGEDDEPGEEEK